MADTSPVDMFASWLRSFSETISANAGELTELDSAIGAADHGSNMDRGMRAVSPALDASEFETADALFKKVGMTLVSTVGGASGPLYGTFFLRFGSALKDVEDASASTVGVRPGAGAAAPLSGPSSLRFGSALKDVEDVSASTVGAALRAGVEGIVSRGKAEVGAKPMGAGGVPGPGGAGGGAG